MRTDDLDALLEAVRARAQDPARRTSVRPTELGEALGALDLGGTLTMGTGLGAMLRNVVAANRAGRVDAEGVAAANELHRQMTTPVDPGLPPPADEATILRAEAALGVHLPATLRRLYAEVADGGFGPAEGLLSLARIVEQYRALQSPGMMPRDRRWPVGVLPVVAMDPGWDCVDAATGKVIAWDPEDLTERSSEDRFRRSFSETHPSVEAWLGSWLESRTHDEERAAMMAELMAPEAQVRQAREARAAIARMSPQERAGMGLPEVGWERVVWGGLGWDEDEPPGS